MSDRYQTYGDDGPAYGDEGPAYGDEGPAYGDEGPAYGDEGPAYSDQGTAQAATYSDDVAYGDEAPSGYTYDNQAYGDQAYSDQGYADQGYADQAYADQGYADQGYQEEAYGEHGQVEYDPAYADGYAAEAQIDEPSYSEASGPAFKPPRKGKARLRRLAVFTAGFLLLGGLGVGGYFYFLAPGGDGGTLDPSAILRAIPFLSVGDSDEVVGKLQDNASTVKRAIDAYAKDHHALPSTEAAIQSQLDEMHLKPMNPYQDGKPIAIEVGDAPKEPGAVAYSAHGATYELRVGNSKGETLKVADADLIMRGKVAAMAGASGGPTKATPVAKAAPAHSRAPGAAKSHPDVPPPPQEAAAPPVDDDSWTGWITKLWPFGNGSGQEVAMKDLLPLEDNLMAVQQAIDAYAQDHHELPGSADAITRQLTTMGLKTANPFGGGAAKITLAKQPAGPGAIAYTLKDGGYELRVGDAGGAPLKIKAVELVLEGTGLAPTMASKPAPAASKAPAIAAKPGQSDHGASAPKAMPSLKPIETAGATGVDKLGGLPGLTPFPHSSRRFGGTPEPAPSWVDELALVPTPGPSMTIDDLKERNRQFDYWRIQGMRLIYSRETLKALDAFKKALEIRPNDPSVKQWVDTINDVLEKNRQEAEAQQKKSGPAASSSSTQRFRGATYARGYEVPPPPRPPSGPKTMPRLHSPVARRAASTAQGDDASKMLDELKKADKVPLLAPPKLDP